MRVFLPLLFRKAKSNIDAKIKFEIAISLMLNILWLIKSLKINPKITIGIVAIINCIAKFLSSLKLLVTRSDLLIRKISFLK